ncbi:MAG: hypothetical protein JNM25_15580 [Planctomycetes bacterium]|nr:hypothetical protein [Planctomycetota bacterium]
MSRDTVPPDCARTDAVLAIYLDGDVGGAGERAGSGREDSSLEDSGFELVCGDSLRDHLLACATCRTQLLRARRLDALLAAQAGRTVDGGELGALATRWFAAIEPAPTAARRPTLARAAGVGCLLLGLGLAACWWLAARPGQLPTIAAPRPAASGSEPRPERGPAATLVPLAAPPAAVPANPPVATGDILIASDASQRRARQPRPDASQRVPTTPELQRVLVDATLPTTERLAAADRLLAAAASRGDGTVAGAALLDALASLGDRDAEQRALHRRVLDVVRGAPHLLGQLQADLQRLDTGRSGPARGDLAVLTVAARLGDRSLDAAIQRAVRRHPDLVEPLAAALRCDVRPAGGAALLLDVWQDLAARGELAVDAAGPCAWFAGQPAVVFADLERALRDARSAPRRIQCLLALGQASDDRSLTTLLEHLQRAPFLEAHAAAFALSCRPRWQLEPLVALARADDMYLLRAALARAAVAAARAWVDAMALGEADRALLAEGSFHDFPRVANWFRDRAFALGD